MAASWNRSSRDQQSAMDECRMPALDNSSSFRRKDNDANSIFGKSRRRHEQRNGAADPTHDFKSSCWDAGLVLADTVILARVPGSSVQSQFPSAGSGTVPVGRD
jgi:hypothetical protein